MVVKIKPRVIRWEEVDSVREWDLEHSGYYFVEGRNLRGEKQCYYFKPFFRETARHGILVFEVMEYLKHYTKKVRELLSHGPDIIFEINEEKWAVEIETGIIWKKNRQQLKDKVEYLRENFGRRWFFVITDRNLVKSYRRYGKTFTRRNIIGKIDKIMLNNGVIYTD